MDDLSHTASSSSLNDSESQKTQAMSLVTSLCKVNPSLRFISGDRLELYNIVIEYIHKDREFLEINAVVMGKQETIYRRDQHKKIPLNEPLPLLGPSRPFLCYSPTFIWFGDFDWEWWFNKLDDGPDVLGLYTHHVDDGDHSRATLYYEWLPDSVEAKFMFSFGHDQVEITKGMISVTTDGEKYTTRVLRFFSEEHDDRVLRKGDTISLYRPIVAVPMGSELHVSVDLTYIVDDSKVERTIKEYVKSSPPLGPQISKFMFHLKDLDSPILNMKITWSDELYGVRNCTSARNRIFRG